jgi:hypothetical protein
MLFVGSICRWGIALIVALAATTASCADEPTTLSDLVVSLGKPHSRAEARKLVDSVVRGVGVMDRQIDQLAVWKSTALGGGHNTFGPGLTMDRPDAPPGSGVCPVVIGAPPSLSDFFVSRLAVVSQSVGGPRVSGHCGLRSHNVVIIFAKDAPAVIHKLAKDSPRAFGFDGLGGLRADLTKPMTPVRAWYGIGVATTDIKASRIVSPTESYIYQALIVVDVERIQGVDTGQIGDYLAFVTLARVRPEALPTWAPSILNLFRDIETGHQPADHLTGLDEAYLAALYATNPRQPGYLQNQQIAARIASKVR